MATNDTYPLASVIAAVADAKGRDHGRTGKVVRSYIRSHFNELSELCPSWETKVNRDSNRYGELTAEARDAILSHFNVEA